MYKVRIIHGPGKPSLQQILLFTLNQIQRRFWVSSPFVTNDGLSFIIDNIRQGIDYRLISRLNEEDIASGLIDPNAIAKYQESGGQARFHNKSLHAKLWIADDNIYIGSANLTGNGLCSNVEIMTEIVGSGDSKNVSDNWFNKLWKQLHGSEKSPQELRDIVNSIVVNPAFGGAKSNIRKPKFKDFGKSSSSNQESNEEGDKSTTRGIFNISGENENRIEMSHDFSDSLKYEGTATTSTNKGHPKWKEGEKVILSYLAIRDNKQHDHCIYGRALVDIAHRPGIDEIPKWLLPGEAISKKDLNNIRTWGYIIWLRDAQIISKARNALWLSEINASFSEPVIKPTSLMQKSYIYLSEDQLNILDSLLEKKFSTEKVEYLPKGSQVWWNDCISSGYRITRDRLEAEANIV